MNDQIYETQRIKELLNSAKNIAIMPSQVAGVDAFCAGAGLYYSLLQMDKQASLVYLGTVPEECGHIVNSDQLTDDIFSRKLVISIDYSDTPASKLAYSNENNILQLVLSPVSKDFDSSKVKTKIQGYNFDLVLMVGVQSPEDLGQVHRELRDDLNMSKVVNIDNTNLNTRHGYINLIDTTASNLSSVVFKLLSKMEIVPDTKAAKALLIGMTYRDPLS